MALFFKKIKTQIYILGFHIVIVLLNSPCLMGQNAIKKDTILSKREYDIAMANYQKKDFEQAIVHLNKGIDANQGCSSCFALRAEIYRLQGKFENSLKDINKTISLNSNDPYWFFIRGCCLMGLDQYKDAISDLTKYISTSNTEGLPYANRAQCFMRLKQYKESLDDINLAISKDNDADYYLQKGELDYYLTNYKDAISDINTSLKMGDKGNEKTVYYFRGMSYYNENKMDSALIDLSAFLKYSNPTKEVYNRLGLCYALKGDSANAKKYIMESFKLDSTDAATYYGYARIEYIFENCKQAKLYCQKAIDIYNRKEKQNALYNLRGLINVCLHDTIAALKDYDQAIKIDNKEMDAHFNKMSLLFDDETKNNLVIKECDEIINSNIDSSELCYIYNLRAFVKTRSHDSIGAESDLKTAIKLSKNKSFIYYNAAVFYFYFMPENAMQQKEVFNYLNQAIIFDNKNIGAYKLLAVCYYYYKKDADTACDLVQKALKWGTDDDLLIMQKTFCSKHKKLKEYIEIKVNYFEFTDGKSKWMKDFLDGYKKHAKTIKHNLP